MKRVSNADLCFIALVMLLWLLVMAHYHGQNNMKARNNERTMQYE